MEGQSGTQAESLRAMQKLEIRINVARVTCFDDVKVGREINQVKPGLSWFKDTQHDKWICIILLISAIASVL